MGEGGGKGFNSSCVEQAFLLRDDTLTCIIVLRSITDGCHIFRRRLLNNNRLKALPKRLLWRNDFLRYL